MDSAYIKFNGGIWSEVLKGRYDLGNYKSAARTCENFIPTRYGQVEKRAGTKHLGYAKEFQTGEASRACVLHPFQFSVNTKFILEFGEQYIRFWSNDLQVDVEDRDTVWATTTAYVVGDAVTESGTTYICVTAHTSDATTFATDAANWYALTDKILEVSTNYLEAELYELQLRAVNDVVYIVHPNHPVAKLTRFADDNWTYTDASLSLPFVDPDVNSTVVTLTPSASSGSITITASADAFDATHVGSELRLKYLEESSSFSIKHEIALHPDRFYPDIFNANDDHYFPFNPTLSGTFGVDNASKRTRVVAATVNSRNKFYNCIQDYDLTAWSAGVYAVDDLVTDGGLAYICVGVTTGGDPAPSVDTDNWNAVINPDDAPAYFSYGVVNMPPQTVSGQWSFKTTGNWIGEYLIQRSIDGGANWNTIRSLVSADDANYLVEEDEGGDAAQIRVLSGEHYTVLEGDVHTFTVLSAAVYGVATVDSYTSATEVGATVTTEMPKTTASISWQESAFSTYQGYPRTVALFDNRLLFAGTKKKPQAFFYSEINNYDNFLAATTLADAPFFVETLSEDQSSVQWLTTQRELFVGTASVEGVLTTRKQDEAQSAENLPIVRWNESMGSAHRPALPLRDSLLTLQRGRTTLNMISYSLDKDGYTGEEVSLLCPHLFSSGVLQMAHLREPYTGAFTVQEDGTLCHMIYEPKLEVTGWCKYTTQSGNFESIAVLPSSGNESTDEDEVWVSVERTINGTTRRHIEHFQVGNTTKQNTGDADNMWYLDAAVKTTGSGLTTITGLDHLDGATVCVLADGIKGSYIVSGNQITLSVPADTVLVGLPVTSEFEPFDLEVQFKGGDTYGKRKQLYDSKLMVWRSLGGSVAHDGQDYQDLIYHTAGETMDESVPLKDGWIEVFHESSYARQKYWRIKHDEPYPFTLQAVIQSFTVSKS